MKRLLSMITAVLMATLMTSAQNGTLDPTNPPEPQAKYKLTVKAQPAEAATTGGSGEYAEGTTRINVWAKANTNYVFKHWTKNGVQDSQTSTSFYINMPAEDVEYVAVFEYQEPEYNPANPAEPQVITPEHTLNLVADPVGAGTFRPASGTKVKEGQTVTLIATPTAGYQFVGWYDADGTSLSTTAQFSYTMPSHSTTLTARFTPIPYDPKNPAEPSGSQDGVDNAADAVTLVARSYTREYGEANPAFEYDVTSGTITSGQPVLKCSATKTSPAGTYPIVITQGSVSNSTVNLVNGTLTITKAPLTISAGNYTKVEGEANPAFTPTFSGFKNGETKSVLTKQPTVTTTATASSPAGTYPVTVGGAEAQNYAISYVNGTLTVTAKPVEEMKPGDVNIDGAVDVADIASVISVMAGGSGIANPLQQTADVNGDGVVDVADIAAIINIMAGGGQQQQTAETKTYTANGISFTMIGVEGGTFQMGSNDGYVYETPVHQVTVSSFSIGQTEVTQALWYAVMGKKPTNGSDKWSSTYGLGDNRPAYYVSWNDCQEFIAKLNQITGQQFRLPTEAEWEFAARGGNKGKGYEYSGSNTVGAVAWYGNNSSSSTHDVATKQANELGIYDMSGNVCEWCSDWYGSYTAGAQTNPTGAASGTRRVTRGGSWNGSSGYCRVADRENDLPSSRFNSIGLRLAL